MTLTISIPPDLERKLCERADALGRDLKGYVEQLVVNDVAEPESTAPTSSLDDDYERGYAAVPEDIEDVAAIIPLMAVGEWE